MPDEINDNDLTLNSYNSRAEQYINGTAKGIAPGGEFQLWLDKVLALIPAGGTVLEIGSGFGRDAEYIRDKGYQIATTDAAQSFVGVLRSKGFPAVKLNVLYDPINGQFDLIYAHAVFHHFTKSQLLQVLSKIYRSLQSRGVLAFSVKKGNGQAWTNEKLGAPRFYKYYQVSELKDLLKQSPFKKYEVSERHATTADWLQVIAAK